MIPTREGVHLTNDEWTTLSLASGHLSQALQLADVSCRVSLGTSRMVTLASDGCGAVTVCIPPGGGIPGNPEAPLKGISLPGTAFQVRARMLYCLYRCLVIMPWALCANALPMDAVRGVGDALAVCAVAER